MTTRAPSLSVLLPVRDAGPWLAPSLASLFRQRDADFEVVAIDDGSNDGSGERLEHAAREEPRLRVTHTAASGLPSALNTALGLARGRLIARHDADDLSHRARFAEQRAFLDSHPEVAVVGSRLRLFPAPEVRDGMRRWAAWHNRLLSHDAMRAEMLIDSPLAHGTAMLRRETLERIGGWTTRDWAEDLDLWIRLIDSGARLAKLPLTLYGWRQHATNSTKHDPRYAVTRFTDLKCDALDRGFLRHAPEVHVAGVGESLARWTAALRRHGRAVTAHEVRRPHPERVRRLGRPLVLVYMMAKARERWRAALQDSDMRELQDFMFVS